jgi:hypothetical protein
LKLCLPYIIALVIEKAPLDKEPILHCINFKSITEKGLSISIIAEIPETVLPIPFFWITVKIPIMKVHNNENKTKVMELFIKNEITLTGKYDMTLNLDLNVVIEEVEVSKLMKICMFGGIKDIDRITLILDWEMDLDIFGFVLKSVRCKKVINLGELQSLKTKTRLKKEFKRADLLRKRNEENQNLLNLAEQPESEKDVVQRIVEYDELKMNEMPLLKINPPKNIENLLPVLSLLPFVNPRLGVIEAGINISFRKPPGLNIRFKTLSFESVFNDKTVAKITIREFELSQFSKDAVLKVQVVPVAISNPIKGPFVTLNSVLNGFVKGAMNGILYGEWGKDSTIIGVRKIKFETYGGEVQWVMGLLNGLEYDYELEAAKQVGGIVLEKTNDLNTAVVQLTTAIIQQSECSIM